MPDRPGAYAVIVDEAWRVAVVVVAGGAEGFHLPGGGIEAGETPEQALHREVAEEAGLRVDILHAMGMAHEVVRSMSGRRFDKCGHYYVCRPTGTAPATDTDHTLQWWRGDRAMQELSELAPRWAVRRALGPC